MELTSVILVLLSICFLSLSLEDAWINDFTTKTRGLTENTGSTSGSKNKIQGNEAAKFKKTTVNVACHSREDARNEALNFGGKGYCDSPIDNDVDNLTFDPNVNVNHNEVSRLFSYYSLGKSSEVDGFKYKLAVLKDGVLYEYRFYYGKNKEGVEARIEEGCEKHYPYYDDEFIPFLSDKTNGNSVPSYCMGIDNEITRLKNEKEIIESKQNFYSDMKLKLLLSENETLKSKVSKLEFILNHFKQENDKLSSELKDKEATIRILKQNCNSHGKTNQELKHSSDQIYKRNSIQILDEDQPESSRKKQKIELNTNLKTILKKQDLSNKKIMDQKQKPFQSTLTLEIKVAPKIRNKPINKFTQQLTQVYVPCGSKESAKQAALNFGETNYCNTPLEHGVKHWYKKHFFPFYTLGRDNQHVVVEKDGMYYDYRFYYGTNKEGFTARKEKECEKPDPDYHDRFVTIQD